MGDFGESRRATWQSSPPDGVNRGQCHNVSPNEYTANDLTAKPVSVSGDRRGNANLIKNACDRATLVGKIPPS